VTKEARAEFAFIARAVRETLMLRAGFRALVPLFTVSLFVFGGCIVDPEMPSENISSIPPSAPSIRRPVNDSLLAPVDTVSHPEPPDSLIDPPAGDIGGLERPHKKDSPNPPDPPQPPAGDVDLGLLSDLTSLGTLYGPGDNWWNLDVEGAPVDPGSDDIIARIASYEDTEGRMHPDFTPTYGIPYCVVGSETPRVDVELRNNGESDNGDPDGLAGYPIPEAAITEGGYIENGGSDSGDRHLLIYDRDRRMVFELSYAEYVGGHWTAGYGAVFKVDSNYRRPEGWTSTDAAGMCVLAGLVRYDEVYGSDPIRHAIRVSIKRTNSYVWPASHEGASDEDAPPLGMRLRLKDSTDLSGLSPEMRKIFQAMKTYGLIVADRGGNMYVQGTMDPRWDNDEINPAFHNLHARDFEVIKLGWRPTS
jgi:hypothetical protein